MHGVKTIVDGNTGKEDLNLILENLVLIIQLDCNVTEIHQAHCLQPSRGGKPPMVLVQLHSKTTRDQCLEKGKTKKPAKIRPRLHFPKGTIRNSNYQ